ncbi:MAG: 50S ribosome-binding GTPase [Synergistaceae bacterium]|nr:50S ribosome-binding GTPase [Synergistaceae bacterium]
MSDYRFDDIDRRLIRMGARPLDVVLIGGTGTGKSTTLNAIFQTEAAKVGHSFAPETMNVKDYMLNDIFRLWDTPGLGDGLDDESHAKKISSLLRRSYTLNGKGNYGLIDLVLVVVDGSIRDLGTVYSLFSDVLLPNIQSDRILTVINHCDMAMSGRHWNFSRNEPDNVLLDFLDSHAKSIRRRIRETTGVNIILPVYYSAEYSYNINRVLDLIIDNIPLERRNLI